MNHAEIKTNILFEVKNCDSVSVVQPVQIGYEGRAHELLMFIKPEIFGVDDESHMQNSLDLIFNKLDAFGAEVNGVVIVGGPALEEKKCMDRHYGAINVLSRTAAADMNDEDRAAIFDKLGVSADEYTIYGGHEFLAAHPGYTPYELDTLWFTKKSIKIRSGFYVQAYEVDGEKFILVDGFHPAQLAHFTESSHRIVLLLIHSDTAWATLRDDMIGDTFPEKADPGSIRGSLCADPANYGFEEVSIANNSVHLSAGPFEGMFEIGNFFGNLMGIDTTVEKPLIHKKMEQAGLSSAQALAALDNSDVTANGETTDLYDATEHMDTDAAVALYQANVA